MKNSKYKTSLPITCFLFAALLPWMAACGGGSDDTDAAGDPQAEDGPETAEIPPDVIDTAPDPVQDTDAVDTLPDMTDTAPDTITDPVEEEPPPECEFDDTTEHGSYCHGVRVDVARDIPGGVPRTHYFLDVTVPDGDYDKRCIYLDEVIIAGDSETIRTDEARYEIDAGTFVLEGEAAPGELSACMAESRIEVFQVRYHGRSPVGTFSGTCNVGGGWRWPPEVTLACHTGLEAGFVADVMIDIYTPPFSATEVYLWGVFGNHGAAALTGFSMGQPTWKTLDWMGESMIMTDPPWMFLDIWSSDPPWEDRVDPGTWHGASFSWDAFDYVPGEMFCPVVDEMDPIEVPSQLVIPGSTSSGSFVIETHPFYCFTHVY